MRIIQEDGYLKEPGDYDLLHKELVPILVKHGLVYSTVGKGDSWAIKKVNNPLGPAVWRGNSLKAMAAYLHGLQENRLHEDVGGIIYNQIMSLDSHALAAWGAYNKAKQGPNNGIVGYMKRNEGYFMFACKCPRFKGKVIILLMPDDTYTIVFGNVGKDSTGFVAWRISKIVEDVYVEDLVRIIDDYVG